MEGSPKVGEGQIHHTDKYTKVVWDVLLGEGKGMGKEKGEGGKKRRGGRQEKTWLPLQRNSEKREQQ